MTGTYNFKCTLSQVEDQLFTIGDVARRSGVATSALRYYESEGLITSARTRGNQRRYHREVLRRIAYVGAAKRVGLTIDEIRASLSDLPTTRAPTSTDWERLSSSWRQRIDDEIAHLERIRDKLTNCIGCGCLSLDVCELYNAGDAAEALGEGPRYLMGDQPTDVNRTA